jgi:hypothetical protein
VPHNRDLAKPLIRARADRLEREAAQMGAKAIALHAYHQLSYKLTKLGECIHRGDWTEAERRLTTLFGPHETNIEVNAVRFAIQRTRELQTFHGDNEVADIKFEDRPENWHIRIANRAAALVAQEELTARRKARGGR